MEAIAIKLGAIALRLGAIALWLEAIASRLEAMALRLEAPSPNSLRNWRKKRQDSFATATKLSKTDANPIANKTFGDLQPSTIYLFV